MSRMHKRAKDLAEAATIADSILRDCYRVSSERSPLVIKILELVAVKGANVEAISGNAVSGVQPK